MNVIGARKGLVSFVALHQDLRCKTLNSFFEGDKSGCTSGASDRHGPPVPPAAPQDGLAQVSGLAFLGPKNSGEMKSDLAFLHHLKRCLSLSMIHSIMFLSGGSFYIKANPSFLP